MADQISFQLADITLFGLGIWIIIANVDLSALKLFIQKWLIW